MAVTISVDNRRLVARLVPAGTRTEAEVPNILLGLRIPDSLEQSLVTFMVK